MLFRSGNDSKASPELLEFTDTGDALLHHSGLEPEGPGMVLACWSALFVLLSLFGAASSRRVREGMRLPSGARWPPISGMARRPAVGAPGPPVAGLAAVFCCAGWPIGGACDRV